MHTYSKIQNDTAVEKMPYFYTNIGIVELTIYYPARGPDV